jgi:hypothetical protein
MKGSKKLLLDIFMGAVVPALVLNYLSRPLGNIPAYVLAAFIPVTYVLVDTFFISRRFNVITSYVALSAIVSGVLVFWFVDGIRYAFKDTVPLLFAAVVFLGSILIGKPIMRFFTEQIMEGVLSPDTDAKKASVTRLLSQPQVSKTYSFTSVLLGAQNLVLGAVNFWLNLNWVTAAFDTELFNSQVATVNGVTRVLFTVIGMGVMMLAIGLVYRGIFSVLPKEEGKSQFESELWDLIHRWEGEHTPPARPAAG